MEILKLTIVHSFLMHCIISTIEAANAWILHGPLARMFNGLLNSSMDLSKGALLEVGIGIEVLFRFDKRSYCWCHFFSIFARQG